VAGGRGRRSGGGGGWREALTGRRVPASCAALCGAS
jgi:hypothetical protein